MAAAQRDVTSKYPSGNVCGSASSIIYAWALDAQKMELPNGTERLIFFFSFSSKFKSH